MPKVSVLLPVYNGEKYIEKSLNSVLNQSFNDLEILVLNDGSTDNSLEIINKFIAIDSRVRAINFEKNIGLIGVLNEGVKKSNGLYLARIDSDDEWGDTDKIEKQVEFLENNPEYALIGTNAILVNEKNEEVGKIDRKSVV